MLGYCSVETPSFLPLNFDISSYEILLFTLLSLWVLLAPTIHPHSCRNSFHFSQLLTLMVAFLLPIPTCGCTVFFIFNTLSLATLSCRRFSYSTTSLTSKLSFQVDTTFFTLLVICYLYWALSLFANVFFILLMF